MNKISIRRARPDDFPEMLNITHRALRELAVDAYPIEEINEAIDTGAWTLTEELVVKDSYFVAEDGGALLGGVGWNRVWLGETEEPIEHRKDMAALRGMFVSPDASGRGIGGRLLRHCIEDVRTAGLPGIELYASFNAEPVYAKYGFKALSLQRLTLQSGAVMMGTRMRLAFTA